MTNYKRLPKGTQAIFVGFGPSSHHEATPYAKDFIGEIVKLVDVDQITHGLEEGSCRGHFLYGDLPYLDAGTIYSCDFYIWIPEVTK